MKKKIFIIIFTIFLFKSYSQDLQLTNIVIEDNSIEIDLKLVNNTAEKTVFYKPDLLDLCTGVFNLFIKKDDLLYEYNTCNEIQHIEAITINCNNKTTLKPKESALLTYRIKLAHQLEQGIGLKCEFNYYDIQFLNIDKKISHLFFRGSLQSNFLNIE